MSQAGANPTTNSVTTPFAQRSTPAHNAARLDLNWQDGDADAARVPLPPYRNIWRSSKRASAGLAALSIGLSLTVLTYGLTRPCVLGQCAAVAQGEKLVQVDLNQLLSQPNLQRELEQTMEKLAAIPSWSLSAAEAKQLTDDLAGLQTILAAQEQAEAQVSSSAEAVEGWQQAIASLNTISPESELHAVAQAHIQKYQHRLAQEKQAQKSFAAAQQAAEMAQLRTKAARSLPDWQLIEATWKTALQRLQEVAAETTFHAESQDLLESYSSKRQEGQKRLRQEELAAKFHHQAASLAKRALDAESNQQWSAAIAHWRNALSTAKQIPQDTFEYQQSQVLESKYAEALNRAQAQQRNRNDLDQVCTNVCHYTVEKHRAKVYLSEAYVKKVRQTAIDAQVRNDLQAQADLLDHIASLEKGLETISHNAEFPIEVYSPQKALLLVFKSNRTS